METNLSLRRMMALAVVFSLLIPILFSTWQTYRQQKAELSVALEHDQQRLVALLANSVAFLAWNMDDKAIARLEEAAAADERIVTIKLRGERVDLPSVTHAERQHGELKTMSAPVFWEGKQLGEIEVDMDTGLLVAHLREQFLQFLATAAAQLALSLTLILFILNVRFVNPIKRLMSESAMLAQLKLDQPFEWRRRDELGTLGKGLDHARIALRTAFGELEQSEQRFRSLTQLSSDWYWERDADDRLRVLSSGFQELTGVDTAGLIGTRRDETERINYAPGDIVEYNKKVAAREPFRDLEWSVRRPDGELRWGVTAGEPVFSERGEFRGYRGIGRDITAYKMAEAARKSEVRLRQLVEHLPAGAIHIESGTLFLNKAAESLTGYSRGEIDTLNLWFAKLFGEHAEELRATYQADRAGGFAAPREVEIRRKDGSLRTVEFAGYLDETSEVWLLHDVTLRQAAQEALEESLIEQRAILDNAIVGIYFQKSGYIQRCNRSLEDMLGYGTGTLIGRPIELLFEDEQALERLKTEVAQSIAQGRQWVGEFQVMRRDGGKVWVQLHGKAIDPDLPARGSIWVMQDITERRAAENALKLALLEQQAIFDNTMGGIEFLKDRIIQRCNRGLEIMLGYGPGELNGKSTRIYFAGEDAWQEHGRQTYPLLAVGRSASGEFEMLRKDGSTIWCLYHAKPVDPMDSAKGSIWVTQDISQRKRTEADLLRAKEGLESSFAQEQRFYRDIAMQTELIGFLQACDNMQEAYDCIASFMPRLLSGSAGTLFLLDDGTRELVAQQAQWGATRASAQSFLSADCWAMRRGQPYHLHEGAAPVRCRHFAGYSEHANSSACLPLVAQGDIFGLLVVEYRDGPQNDKAALRDRRAAGLTEQIGLALANLRLREKLRAQSIRDPLTGLFNRRHMDIILRRELSRAKRNKARVAAAVVDVDHFKKFNDTHGHDAGDAVLQSVARSLEERIRENDLVCRFGGEEFVVVLPDIEFDLAIKRMEHLLAGICELELNHNSRQLGRITASFGLAFFPDHGGDVETLLKSADEALYVAKEAGRNRVVVKEMMESGSGGRR